MYNSSKIHVVITSELTAFRQGIKSIIEKEEGFTIIETTNNLNDIFNILNKSIPQIIINP